MLKMNVKLVELAEKYFPTWIAFILCTEGKTVNKQLMHFCISIVYGHWKCKNRQKDFFLIHHL